MSSRKSLLSITAILALAAAASAQVSTYYNFSQSAGTYSPLSGGTQIAVATGTSGATSLDDVAYSVALPFSFTFDGAAYSSIYANTNGSITFGATLPGSNYSPLSSTTTYNGAIAAFAADLQAGYVFKCDRVTGTNTLTNVSSTGPIQVGDILGGTGIPTGTTITAIAGNTITMSANATTTGTAGAAGAVGPWAEMRYETLGTAPNQVFVVQWQNFKRFSFTSLTAVELSLNFQIRLHENDGKIEVVYGNCSPGQTTTTGTCQVGLRGPTNAFPANINNRLNTKGVNDDWANSVIGTANSSGMLFNSISPANVITSGLTYDWAPNPGVPATNTSYGTGCYSNSATWFEQFGSFDLSGSAIRMIPNGQGGYTMIPGAPTAFVHTVPGLALIDDSVGTLALPSAFNYPGGSTTSLSISSNGFIWLQTSTVSDFSPTAAELFSNPARFCPLWCDMVPDGATNLNNVYAEVDVANNKAYVTWSNVPTFSAGGTVNAQVEFDLTTGDVNLTYGAVTLPAITAIAGWTPGTGFSSLNIGSQDVSVALPGSFSTGTVETLPLTLSAGSTPALGTTVVYTTSNIPATSLISADLISLGQINPGVGIAGAPGCLQLVDLSLASTTLLIGSPSATLSLSIPNDAGLVGLPLNVQSASFVPGVNPLNVITSNGVRSVVGNF